MSAAMQFDEDTTLFQPSARTRHPHTQVPLTGAQTLPTGEADYDEIGPSDEYPDANPTSRLTRFLRWAGGASVLLGAVLFMLQGVDALAVDFQSWAYVAMVALLSGAGLATLFAFKDSKAARLLFGLATAALPVQLSQVASMIFDNSGRQTSATAWGLATNTTNTESLLAVGGISLLMLLPVAFAGFASLVRPHARTLALMFSATALTILLPFRSELAHVSLIFGLLALLTLWELLRARRSALFNTAEGIAARALLLAPAIIVLGRSMFYMDFVHFAATAAIATGLTLALIVRHWFAEHRTHALLGIGNLLTVAGWLAYATTLTNFSLGFTIAIAGLPIAAALFLTAAPLGHAGVRYRQLGALIGIGALGSLLLLDGGGSAQLTALLVGFVFAGSGVHRKERTPVAAGIVGIAGAVIGLLISAFGNVDMSSWIALASLGLGAILLSSVLERYGNSLLQHSRRVWGTVQSWQ